MMKHEIRTHIGEKDDEVLSELFSIRVRWDSL